MKIEITQCQCFRMDCVLSTSRALRKRPRCNVNKYLSPVEKYINDVDPLFKNF